MKTIGMLGGMSWESTASYYKEINERVAQTLGGLHSAKICLYSVDFEEIARLQRTGDWDKTIEILASAAKSVEQSGADCLLICTNTMHKIASEVGAQISIPILHIADATAQCLVRDNVTIVGLLGTRFTMEQDFYKGRIAEKFGIEAITPNADDQTIVHNVIFDELCKGVINPQSKEEYIRIINDLYTRGAQAVILGCTEIALLVEQADTSVPLYDTTSIHATSAVEFALTD